MLLGLQDYLVQLDPSTSLGLGGDSIYRLNIGDVVYSPGMCSFFAQRNVFSSEVYKMCSF